MGNSHRSGVVKKSNDTLRLFITTLLGMVLGYFIGVSFPSISLSKIKLLPTLATSHHANDDSRSFPENLGSSSTPLTPKIYVPTNPHGAESLPPGIVVSESDFFLRRLWGEPNEGESKYGKAPWEGVRERCRNEWAIFQDRLATADKAYFSQL